MLLAVDNVLRTARAPSGPTPVLRAARRCCVVRLRLRLWSWTDRVLSCGLAMARSSVPLPLPGRRAAGVVLALATARGGAPPPAPNLLAPHTRALTLTRSAASWRHRGHQRHHSPPLSLPPCLPPSPSLSRAPHFISHAACYPPVKPRHTVLDGTDHALMQSAQ